MQDTSQHAELTAGEAMSVEEAPGILGTLWRRKWTVICMVVIAVPLGYLYFLQAPRVYRSSTQILLIRKGSQLSPNENNSHDSSAAYGFYENTLATQMSLICSPMIVGAATKEHHLGSLASLQGLREDEIIPIIGAALKASHAGGVAAPDPNVMEVQYDGSNPGDCQTVLGAVVQSYQAFLGRKYQNFGEETVQLIRQAKDILHTQLSEKENAYRAFRQNSPLLQKGDEVANPHEVRRLEIENARSKVLVELAQTRARQEALQAALKAGSNREALGLLAMTSHSDSSSSGMRLHNSREPFEERVVSALLDEQELLEQYGPDHPKVKAVRRQIHVAREGLGMVSPADDTQTDFTGVYLESLAEEIKVGERRLAELNKLFDEEHRLAANLASFEAQEEAFHNEIDRLRRLFNDTMKRVEEIDLLKDYGGISAEPISPPLPGSLIRPKLPVIFGFSAFSGLFLGLALAYLIDLGDKRLRSEEDVCRDIGLTVLGHIPLLPRNQGRRRTRPGGPALHPALCVYHQPAGPEAEAFRALRTALSCGRLKDDCKVIQVSSPTPGDGKTFVAVNLAISLATSGKKVLLLDTDLRHPTVHEQLALPNDTGLSSVLEGHSEILAAIQETAVANLWAMSSGPIPRHPAELLGSPGFKEVLDVVRDRYDLVVVDASPLLTVSDPAIIAPAMDGVLLVTRLGQRKGDQRVMQVIDTLNLLGIRPLGIVMNGSDQRASYGYGSYHYDGDYNGERYQAVH